MNESIEDEKGLMSKKDFKKMLFTSFGRIPQANKQIVYDMLLTIISADPKVVEDGANINVEDFIQIEKLAKFIDFYNYVPIMINKIRHKNDSSDDLATFMGKIKDIPENLKINLEEYEEDERFKIE